MPPTINYSFGDIVLVSFPFTDQSAAKQRPAAVVSSETYHQRRRDLIIMAVTSQMRPNQGSGDLQVTDWEAAGLLKPSTIKPVFATVEQRIVIKRLGRLKDGDQQRLGEAITHLTGSRTLRGQACVTVFLKPSSHSLAAGSRAAIASSAATP